MVKNQTVGKKTSKTHTAIQEQEFIAQVSHDMKSSLTSVKAYVQLLQRQLLSAQDQKALLYTEKINSQINKVVRMMSDFVDVYRIKAGKLELYKEPYAIDQLMLEIVESMQMTTTTHTISLQGNSSVLLSLDKARFMQAIRNVLHNAIKFSPEQSSIIVTIQKDVQTLSLTVKDFGSGISEEDLQTVFDPFLNQRVKGSPGVGSGLFIASSIVQAHSGELSIESKIGKGTKVFIRLPIEQV